MSKGGARARSGPAPDPNSLTQVDGEWTILPASGREGAPPRWPLSESTDREDVLWAAEWARPQAVEWERQGQEIEVALFVRSIVAAEAQDATTASRTLVRQQMEALGISVPGMLRNRWRIAEPDLQTDAGPARASSRDRLTVLTGGA